jgi:hypothetical protein
MSGLKLTVQFERSDREWKATLLTSPGVVGYGSTIAESAQSLLDSLIVAGLKLHEKQHQPKEGGQ